MPRDLLKNRKKGNALNYKGVFRLACINKSFVFITMKISGILEGLAPIFLIWETNVMLLMWLVLNQILVVAAAIYSCIQMTVCRCLLISVYPDLTVVMIYHWRGLYFMSKLGMVLKCVVLHSFACADYVCLLEPSTNFSCVAFISRNHRFHRDRH